MVVRGLQYTCLRMSNVLQLAAVPYKTVHFHDLLLLAETPPHLT